MKKKAISLFLATILLLGVMSLSVNAAGHTTLNGERATRAIKQVIASAEVLGFELP